MAGTLVFVFGTLKQGFPNFAVNQGRRFGGVFCTLERLPLWLVGERHVPWLIDSPGEGEQVAGEVYEVDDAALAAMDELEGVGLPDGYHRTTIRVRSPDDPTELSVQIYMKHAHQLVRAEVRQGPLAEYTPAHATLYRKRGEQAY
ncbi:MAG TPA: gamma-glutamylcyclotransferase family protein [Burkholderiaceae bacterium]|nr:gamma-glutamylcyclotransferase family protein [Burkholderiaceae bacterium]